MKYIQLALWIEKGLSWEVLTQKKTLVARDLVGLRKAYDTIFNERQRESERQRRKAERRRR